MQLTFRRRRIKPLLDIHSITRAGSRYPTTLLVPMTDGRVIRYSIECHPGRIHTGRDGWEKTGRQVVGYETKSGPSAMTGRKQPKCYRW